MKHKTQCPSCKGHGVVLARTCTRCGGAGILFPWSYHVCPNCKICKTCTGKGIVPDDCSECPDPRNKINPDCETCDGTSIEYLQCIPCNSLGHIRGKTCEDVE